jgi:hypothetical protein
VIVEDIRGSGEIAYGALHCKASARSGATRDASIMVIYVLVGFRPGYPEVSERNMTFSAIRSSGRLASDDSTIEIRPAVAPGPADTVVTKHRVSAPSLEPTLT